MSALDIIALGGNAILPVGMAGTIQEQVAITRTAMLEIEGLVSDGRRIVLTHGNGPIVGNIVVRNEAMKDSIPPMPLDVCGADSQGGVGYMIQQALRNVLVERGCESEVVSIITQVLVDVNDPAFQNPVKPIGPYYDESQALQLRKDRGWDIVEDKKRGYRRVVPSPYPMKILEIEVIKSLIRAGTIVITVGGGGIPVVCEDNHYRGIEAVIDKDLASSLLARQLDAQRLIIITDIDAVYLDYGKPTQRPLGLVALEDIKSHFADGQFPEGSMGSKMKAVIEFLEYGGDSAIVTQPGDLLAAVRGEAGTTIRRVLDDGN